MTWPTFCKSIFAGWFWPRCTICDEFYDECEHSGVRAMRPGDHVEFRSDRQTDKGPCTGKCVLSEGRRVALAVSDALVWFDLDKLLIERETTHGRTGRRLWMLL